MKRGELFINGKDAYRTWGVYLEQGALASLICPPPVKAFVENTSSVIDGKQVFTLSQPLLESRDVQLNLVLTASTQEEFYARYNAFVDELLLGVVNLETRFQEGVVYHLLYRSCHNLKTYNGTLAKVSVKFNEYNPAYRE